MPNPTTPNLGLNKIDRTSPETTYFDLNKYIDQNAEKVDSFAGEVQEEISALKDRLDHAVTKEITLNPGLQVVNSPKDSRFKLSEIQGRTLINLLGVAGGCEEANSWSAPYGMLSVDATIRDSGMASLKYTHSSSSSSGAYVRSNYFPIDPSKYLLIAAWVKSVSKSVSVRLVTTGGENIQYSFGRFHAAGETGGVAFRVFTPSNLGANTSVCVEAFSNDPFAIGDTFNFDSFRVYQLTADEYAQLNESTPDSYINYKYPFVPCGIIGVENPYAISYGENLLPPFYEWESLHANAKVIEPYRMKHTTTTNANEYNYHTIPALEDAYYDLFVQNAAGDENRNLIKVLDDSFSQIAEAEIGEEILEGNIRHTWIKTPPNAKYIRVYLYPKPDFEITAEFISPILAFNDDEKSFKPQRKTMLALQTELHANPEDGSEPDVLFEKEGQYFKLAKWKKVVLDGALTYEHSSNYSVSGSKRIRIPNMGRDATGSYNGAVVKYTGVTLEPAVIAGWSKNDQWGIDTTAGHTLITISNAESGWGDSYTPTADEVKAYFMGWKMSVYGGTRWDNYNGTGTKVWIRITRLNDSVGLSNNIDYTTTLPTVDAGTDALGNTYKPYQLLYRLAKEVVEPVPFEGALVLPEGQSVVEVGTGIVLREVNKPTPVTSSGVQTFNGTADPLSYRAGAILSLYENGRYKKVDVWGMRSGGGSVEISNGPAFISLNNNNYDEMATYTITYIKFDKSHAQPIKGVVANNEKAQISDLVDAAAAIIGTIPIETKGGAGSEESENGAIRTVIPYTTTKSGDAYTIATSDVLVANQQITVKFNANSSGTPMLKFGGTSAYPIKKANGSAAKFYASVYTLFFDGSAFILSGEGGEVESYGTATASDVLASKTILTTNGLVTGTMSNRGAVTNTITTQNGQYTIPAGYHNGSGKVTASFANLVAGNIKKDVNIGGITGSLEPSVKGSMSLNYTKTGYVSDYTTIATFPVGITQIAFIADSSSYFQLNSASGLSLILTDGSKRTVLLSLYEKPTKSVNLGSLLYDKDYRMRFRNIDGVVQYYGNINDVALDPTVPWQIYYETSIWAGNDESTRTVNIRLVGKLYYS
ncbi:hypothetical protein [Paenibacillus barengoltzii]|uniref:Uncharacterized protein n=1 Tax=Paenibacillus barengoltzii G22 TaxID=1235795 RepID=R9LFW0_9BACL|nr:hypothetical protein [Paenibacillus barengoltzii]EOS57669.1 hypothetical protein C812_00714 [Paenibacillus barengoltzii G22]